MQRSELGVDGRRLGGRTPSVRDLTEVQVGILAVYMDGIPIDRVDDLCTTIEQTIHG